MKNTTRTFISILFALMLCMTGCSKEEVATEAVETVDVATEAVETVDVSAKQLGHEKGVIVPIEACIETGADFDALETLPVGKYHISATNRNITLEVYEKVAAEPILAEISDGKNVEYLYEPVLIKDGEAVYLYGKIDWFKALDRVQIFADHILEKEENVVWTDFPSKDINKCTGAYNTNGFATLGETVTENGWHYAIYSNGEELAGIDSEDKLKFFLDEGIAISEDGEVYLLYYTENSMEAYKVPLPDKAKLDGFAYIDKTYNGYYGYASVYCEYGNYIIKTENHQALCMNGLDYIEKDFNALEKMPSYTVIKSSEPENFDSFQTWVGSETQAFFVTCYLEYGEDYKFEHVEIPYSIEKRWLGLIIPEEELNKVWNKKYTSYSEVEDAIEDLNKFLDDMRCTLAPRLPS